MADNKEGSLASSLYKYQRMLKLDDLLMIVISYLMKRKIKKIFFEIISNNKIFYKILFKEVANNQDFVKLSGRD